jgi:hypothetical protein
MSRMNDDHLNLFRVTRFASNPGAPVIGEAGAPPLPRAPSGLKRAPFRHMGPHLGTLA